MLSRNNNSHCIKTIDVTYRTLPPMTSLMSNAWFRKVNWRWSNSILFFNSHNTAILDTKHRNQILHLYSSVTVNPNIPTSVNVLRKADSVIKVKHTNIFLRSVCKNFITPPTPQKTLIFILYYFVFLIQSVIE